MGDENALGDTQPTTLAPPIGEEDPVVDGDTEREGELPAGGVDGIAGGLPEGDDLQDGDGIDLSSKDLGIGGKGDQLDENGNLLVSNEAREVVSDIGSKVLASLGMSGGGQPYELQSKIAREAAARARAGGGGGGGSAVLKSAPTAADLVGALIEVKEDNYDEDAALKAMADEDDEEEEEEGEKEKVQEEEKEIVQEEVKREEVEKKSSSGGNSHGKSPPKTPPIIPPPLEDPTEEQEQQQPGNGDDPDPEPSGASLLTVPGQPAALPGSTTGGGLSRPAALVTPEPGTSPAGGAGGGTGPNSRGPGVDDSPSHRDELRDEVAPLQSELKTGQTLLDSSVLNMEMPPLCPPTPMSEAEFGMESPAAGGGGGPISPDGKEEEEEEEGGPSIDIGMADEDVD